MNPLKYVAPATRARRGAQREAAKFAATVKPGHTYYSITDNHARYPGAPAQILMEWKFTAPGRWIGQEARCGHLTAAGVWLGYGPLHENRPSGPGGKIPTLRELQHQPGILGPASITDLELVPAGV